jgi:hypothetical protein
MGPPLVIDFSRTAAKARKPVCRALYKPLLTGKFSEKIAYAARHRISWIIQTRRFIP